MIRPMAFLVAIALVATNSSFAIAQSSSSANGTDYIDSGYGKSRTSKKQYEGAKKRQSQLNKVMSEDDNNFKPRPTPTPTPGKKGGSSPRS